MAPELMAFLDESRKPVRSPSTGRATNTSHYYVVAAAMVLAGDVRGARASIKRLEAELGYRLHYADLRSRRRRLEAVEAISHLDGWDGYLFETAGPLTARHFSEHHVRAKILGKAFTDLGAENVLRVVLETRAHPQRRLDHLDAKDHQVLQRLLSQKAVPADLRIAHADKSEALLTIADVLAGARSDYLCGGDRVPYPLLAHRVRRVNTVFGRLP